MSHDRKPGRVRVLKAGAGSAQRRPNDKPPIEHVGASAAGVRSSARRGRMMLILVFLLVAMGGAVITELYLPA